MKDEAGILEAACRSQFVSDELHDLYGVTIEGEAYVLEIVNYGAVSRHFDLNGWNLEAFKLAGLGRKLSVGSFEEVFIRGLRRAWTLLVLSTALGGFPLDKACVPDVYD